MNANAPDLNFDTLAGMESEGEMLDAKTPGAAPLVEETPPAPSMPSAEILKPALAWAAKNFAPNWNVSIEETNKLGDALGAVVDKWVPDGALGILDRWKEEITLVVTVFAIMSTRSGMPLVKPAKEEAASGGGVAHGSTG